MVNHGAPAIDAPDGSALAAVLAAIDTVEVAHHGGSCADVPLRTPRVPAAGVTAFAKRLVESLTVARSVRIARIRSVDGGYELGDEQGNGQGTFDGIVVSAPAPQAADLLAMVAHETARTGQLRAIAYEPAIVVIGVASPGPGTPSIWELDGAIRRISAVPGPDAAATVTALLDTERSATLLDAASDAELIAQVASDAAAYVDLVGPVEWDEVKRWRFSTVSGAAADPIAAAIGDRIVLCGDAICGPGMSAIWDSGIHAAKLLRDELGRPNS